MEGNVTFLTLLLFNSCLVKEETYGAILFTCLVSYFIKYCLFDNFMFLMFKSDKSSLIIKKIKKMEEK